MLYLRADRESIPVMFHDPYLELLRLLVEAASLEHTLLVAYLSAMFSVKPAYKDARGDIRLHAFLEHDPAAPMGTAVVEQGESFLSVAIEEMQHLSLVNSFLAGLEAAPNLAPHELPHHFDIYPFNIEQQALSRYSAATFMWIEADNCALSLSEGCAGRSLPRPFVQEVRRVLAEGGAGRGDETPDHLGSLYKRIEGVARQVASAPPAWMPPEFDWADQIRGMQWIRQEGEVAHFQFFRDVFTGKAFGADETIWKDPDDPAYPAYPLTFKTAYPNHPDSIWPEPARRIAWLADLHYWIILCLLDARFRLPDLSLQYHCIDNMTRGLWSLGLFLAENYQVGLPFDQFGPDYGLGRSPVTTCLIVDRLVAEATGVAAGLEHEGLLPRHLPGSDEGGDLLQAHAAPAAGHSYDLRLLATVHSALKHK